MLFEQARLEIAAIKNRVIGKLRLMLKPMRLQLHHYLFGLFFIVLASGDADRIAVAQIGPEFLLEQLLVIGDQRIGRFQDAHRRAVILFELDDLELRVVARQPAQILDIRPAPAVNRLVIVAHGGKGGAHAGQLAEQAILASVRILIFIDEQITQPMLPFFQRFGKGLEQHDRQRDQIVKIHRLVGFQRRHIARIGLCGSCFRFVASGAACRIGRNERILPVRDLRLQAADRRLVGAAGKVGHDAQRIGRIKNRKVRLVAKRPRLLAQNAHTQRVEGGNGQPLRPATQQLFDALPHLPRRLVGKGDGGDRRRRQAARAD